MRHLISSRRPSVVLILAPLALALAACSPGVVTVVATPTTPLTSTHSPSPTTSVPHAAVVRVSKVQHFPDSKSGGTSSPCANGDPLINGDCGVTVTATCPSGKPVVSGGYTVDDFLAFVTSSYPASTSAWTVTVHDEGQDGDSHPVTVTAYADCLQANFTATTQIVSSTPSVPADSNPYTKSVSCPSGTALTGGGFRGSNGTQRTRPAGNSWQAALSVQVGGTAKPSVFAVCTKGHLAAAAAPSVAKAFGASKSGAVSVACSSGKLLVGGGSLGNGSGSILSNAADTTNVSHWQLQVKGPTPASGPGATFTATVFAVCVAVA